MKKVRNNYTPLPQKKPISNYGTKKYITVENNTKVTLYEQKITVDSLWDGLHGIYQL